MAAGKERIIICEECGAEVVTKYSRTRFCPKCAEERAKTQYDQKLERLRQERAMEDKVEPEEPIHLCDSPERIQQCLNCTKPYCTNCFAYNKSLSAYRKPMVLLKDIRADLVKAIKRGDANGKICYQFNISSSTLSRWVRKLKEEGVL